MERTFAVKLKRNVHMAEDPGKNCVDYPNKGFESYNECDDQFLVKALPAEIVPVWATDNKSLVTRFKHYPTLPTGLYDFGDLFDGSQRSTCPLPCSTYSVDSRLISDEITTRNISVLNLTFNQHVIVTSHSAIKFTFASFLSDVGGGLGLWLGLGVAQFLDALVAWVTSFVKNIQCKCAKPAVGQNTPK